MRLQRTLIKNIRSLAVRHRASSWVPNIVRRLGRNTAEQLQHRYHVRMVEDGILGRTGALKDIVFFLSERPVSIRAPMLMISQAQRSGGSLLSQLFDGHPQIAVYPHELRLGYVEADRWPQPDPDLGVSANFHMLFDLKFPRLVRRGFTKGDRDKQRHAFFLVPRLQYAIFKALFDSTPPRLPREVLDLFFTAFFNAWLNYQGDLEKVAWIGAFAPRLAHDEENVTRFFECYRDGMLVQIVRDPASWYPSAKNHREAIKAGRGPEEIVDMWVASGQSMLRNREKHGARVIILRFEDLVGSTEKIMRRLAHELGIAFDPILLKPTFNGRVMSANSSFAVEQSGVISAPLSRKALLLDDERTLIERSCRMLYQRLLGECLAIDGSQPQAASAYKEMKSPA